MTYTTMKPGTIITTVIEYYESTLITKWRVGKNGRLYQVLKDTNP